MDEQNVFLRFDGTLSEDMAFKPRRGWETSRIGLRPPEGDDQYLLQLRDANDRTLTQVKPSVVFLDACYQSYWTMRTAEVIAYIPYHPSARRMIFQRNAYVIYEAPVAKDQPVITINRLSSDGDTVSVSWQARHAEAFALSFNIAYVSTDKENIVMLAQDLNGYEAKISLEQIPGGEGRLLILVTDGIRSSLAMTDPFTVKQKPLEVWITSPRNGSIFPPGHPVSLIGQVVDVLGRKLPNKGLIWEVDGRALAKDVGIAPAVGLKPGRHRVSLLYRDKTGGTAGAKVSFSIAEYNEAQQRFRQVMRQDQ